MSKNIMGRWEEKQTRDEARQHHAAVREQNKLAAKYLAHYENIASLLGLDPSDGEAVERRVHALHRGIVWGCVCGGLHLEDADFCRDCYRPRSKALTDADRKD